MFAQYKPIMRGVLLCCAVITAHAQFSQLAPKLVGSASVGLANQGTSVALSADGSTAIVGGPFDNNEIGAAWIFVRSGAAWQPQGGKLVGSGAVAPAWQGQAVALSADGNTALVGGPQDSNKRGSVWVFVRSNGVWTQQAKLTATGADAQARFGSAVALSADGKTALIGAEDDLLGMGAAYVFTRSGSIWTQQGTRLTASGFGPFLGISVALSADGNTALLGGVSGDRGAGFVYTRSAGVWTRQGPPLTGADEMVGGTAGISVALSGDGGTALIGWIDDNNYVGAAWVFTRSGVAWSQQGGKLVGSGAVPSAQQSVKQGSSVALSADGNTAAIGGPDDNNHGAVWVFRRIAGAWIQQGNKLVAAGDAAKGQGSAVALSANGGSLLSGGRNDNGGLGAAWVFTEIRVVLTPSANPSLFGQPVAYLASVHPLARGIVTFVVDGIGQASVPLVAGQAQFMVPDFSPGSHTVAAVYSGDGVFAPSMSDVLQQAITPKGVISLWANTALGLGQSARLPVSLALPAPPQGLTIYLNSADPSKVTVTPSVFIPGGRTIPNAQPQVNGLNLGTVPISATALGYLPDTESVHVIATLAFANCCVTVTGAGPQNVTLTLSAPAPPGGLKIPLTGDDPQVVGVPAFVLIPAGATSTTVPVEALSPGTTTVRAGPLPDMVGAILKVTVR
jgi:hypothetical protein